MLSNLNSSQVPNKNNSIQAQPLPVLGKSEELKAVDEKRALVISRLQAAKMCEVMGKNPWNLISNSAYEQCDRPCITVIVTLFNYSEYIYECLDSVCKSEVSDLSEPIEILVIDDCSTDMSASMVEEYLNKSSMPIGLIKKSFNTGLADARNVGLKVARSPYVFILDADNWIYSNCLSILYNTIKSSNHAGVYSSIRQFNHLTKEEIGLISCCEWDVHKLVENPYIDAMAMFDKNTLLKVGGYSTELIEYGWFGWEDYDLWLKFAQLNYSCKQVPKVLSSYRIHSSSMINTTNNYTLNIAKYFSKKFANLVKSFSNSERLFGFQYSEIFPQIKESEPQPDPIECLQQEIQNLQQEIQILHDKTENLQQQNESLHQQSKKYLQELQQACTTVAAMESSKFWQFRNKWFKLKKVVGLAEDIEVKI
jgi:glycosyltransferase involved in cell wall biosynthesis